MGWRGLVLCVLVVLGSTACYEEPVAITTFPPSASGTPNEVPSTTPTATERPTQTPARTDAPTQRPSPTATAGASSATGSPTEAGGSPSSGCINGWIRPVPGSPEHLDAIAILRAQLGVDGGYTIDDMRYFTGPELPNVEPQYDSVDRWYVRGEFEPELRGRFLLERRTEEIAGISAVAPYATSGYASPDWTGFIGEGPPTTYLGLPGQWSGVPYDFVTGAGDGGFPGLPMEVVDCLSGT